MFRSQDHPQGADIVLCLITYLITYSVAQSPSSEANFFAASQEILRISRNQKVHYRTHNRPPPVSILGQPNPVHMPTTHLLEIRPNIIHPSTPRSPPVSPPRTYTPPSPHPYAPHAQPISFFSIFITRTILGEQYKSFSSSLRILLHSSVTSSFLCPNILLNAVFSNTLSFLSLPQCQRPCFTPIQNNRQNYISIYLDIPC